MRIWSELRAPRFREQMSDLATIAWVGLWVSIAFSLFQLIAGFAEAGRTIRGGGETLTQGGRDLGSALAGIPAVGQGLTVQGGSFTAAPASLAYAWLRCNANGRLCVPVAGAAAEVYTVTREDSGHALVCQVTAAAAGARAVVLSTAATIPA